MTAAEAHDLPRGIRPARPRRFVPRPRRPDENEVDDLRRAASDLLDSLLIEPMGQVSASVYETARLVTLAPWLLGHRERIAFLLANQRGDGGWGGPAGYALVPTLSATEALLTTMDRTAGGAEPVAAAEPLRYAVERGLAVLSGWLSQPSSALPDMPAIELIVPALVTAINQHLDTGAGPEATGGHEPLSWAGRGRLPVPDGMRADAPAAIAARLRAGHGVSEKVHHALEVAGHDATRAAGVRPGAAGSVGASPAA
ncbi:MAG TPA: hypothetical protein VF163_20440, partial [Micromonosporaceae bacterium]